VNRERTTGFTIVELLVVVAVIALLVGILLPAIGKARDAALVNASKSNLRQMGVAHKMYAADWADRQVTYVRDNLGLYGGDVCRYSKEMYDSDDLFDGHPPILAGRGWTLDGRYIHYGQSPVHPGYTVFQPINFPGPPYPGPWVDGWGWFLIGHRAQPMNVYLNGRWHDPIFWPPKDRVALDQFEPCFPLPGEYVGDASNNGIGPDGCRGRWTLSGYSLSSAGLFSPDVF
jgi:prepilin-type N-terminal cleavage/methylation domain-containing protein